MGRSLAVVGAGVAGIGAAYALSDTGIEVTLFERRDAVGGRVVTRRSRGCVYDVGANYLKPVEGRDTAGLLDELGTDGLVDVREPVWTFTADGEVSPGDREDDHKWTYEAGIEEFARRALARADAAVERGTAVGSLARDAGDGDGGGTEGDGDGDGWWALADPSGAALGRFDAVLLTPPAPETAALLGMAKPSDGRLRTLREAAGAVPYRPIRTLVLHYPFPVEAPYYALVNVDREHPVGWLSREGCKRGHVPAGESLLVVQMSPAWSAAHLDDPHEGAAREAARHAADLVGDDRLCDPDWTDDRGWRHALPDAAVGADVTAAEDAGLFLAGDWVVGRGRAIRAFWSGVDAGERIAASR